MKIFVSYSTDNDNVVDVLEEDLKKIGIELVFSAKYLEPWSSISEARKKIHTTDFVLIVISDSFFKSRDTLNVELMKYFDSEGFVKKLLVIELSDIEINNIFERIDIIGYWENEIERIDKELKKLKSQSDISNIQRDLNHYNSIRRRLDSYFEILNNTPPPKWNFQKLQKENYQSFLKFIGSEQEQIELKDDSELFFGEDKSGISEDLLTHKALEADEKDVSIIGSEKLRDTQLIEIKEEKEYAEFELQLEISKQSFPGESVTREVIPILVSSENLSWETFISEAIMDFKDNLEFKFIHSLDDLMANRSFEVSKILIVNNQNKNFNQAELKDFFKGSNITDMIYFGVADRWKGKQYISGYQATEIWERIHVAENENQIMEIFKQL